jgi:hypothetical protein
MMSERTTDVPTGIPKEYRKVLRVAREQGWTFSVRNGYPQAWPPDGASRPVAVPKTPKTSGRAFANWLAEMKRGGLEWP